MHYDDDMEHIYLDDEDPRSVKIHERCNTSAVESREEYKKFGYIICGILLVSMTLTFIRGVAIDRFLADFMAVFLITLAASKFIDIESFAHAYRQYDIFARRIRPWGYMFPFLEVFIGFWYLLSDGPNNLNILTMIVMGTAAVGALKEIKRQSRFSARGLGSFIRLPLARVGVIENVTIFGMAFILLVL